jgi:hypothetical protein
VFRCVLGSEGCVLVPRSSGTPVAMWAWPTWVVSQRRVLEAVFILLEFPSPSRRIFIGSHSLPPLWFAVSVLHCASTFVRRPSTERATCTVVHREFIVTRNLKLIQSSLVRCCCLRNLLGLLGWGQILPGSACFLMTPSKQDLMRVT